MGRKLEELKAVPDPTRELAAPGIVEDVPRRMDVAPDDDLAILPLFDMGGRDPDRRGATDRTS